MKKTKSRPGKARSGTSATHLVYGSSPFDLPAEPLPKPPAREIDLSPRDLIDLLRDIARALREGRQTEEVQLTLETKALKLRLELPRHDGWHDPDVPPATIDGPRLLESLEWVAEQVERGELRVERIDILQFCSCRVVFEVGDRPPRAGEPGSDAEAAF